MNNNVGLAVRNSAPMVNVPTIKNGEIDVFKLGEVFARSGYFTDAKDASQAIVKIIAGSEIGIGAMASMTGFHIVNGKPVLAANLIASLIKNKKSGYNYRVLEMDDTVCEIEFFENGEPIGKSKFSMDDARTAGITGKDVWKKFPKNMLFARAISNGAKWFCPDVFNGSMVYTPEELGVEVDGDGEILQMPQSLPQQPEPLKQIASSLTETEEKILAEMKVLLEAAGESEKIIADSEKRMVQKNDSGNSSERFAKSSSRGYQICAFQSGF